jgi:hypothetical protein
MARVWIVISIVVVVLGACAPKQEGSGRVLTERQRDSVLSRSKLPGASAIQRTMSTTDAEARRAAQMNAQVDSLPH